MEPTTGGQQSTGMSGGAIAGVVLLVVGVIAGGATVIYFTTRKPSEPANNGTASSTKNTTSVSDAEAKRDAAIEAQTHNAGVETKAQVDSEWHAPFVMGYSPVAPTTTVTNPVHTNFDEKYNYQNRDGVWWTARKATPDKWLSLANYPDAIAKLDKKYPLEK